MSTVCHISGRFGHGNEQTGIYIRLSDEIFDKIGALATKEHRSMTNYIEFVLLQHIPEIEKLHGEVKASDE